MAALALAYGRGPVSLSRVAAEQRIPPKYLEQVIVHLRRAGLVRARRGPAGGYELALPPESISVASVLQALGGGVLQRCCGVDGVCAFSQEAHRCRAKGVWDMVQTQLERSLSAVTLAQLATAEAASGAEPAWATRADK
jgi:Rrf2 family protein